MPRATRLRGARQSSATPIRREQGRHSAVWLGRSGPTRTGMDRAPGSAARLLDANGAGTTPLLSAPADPDAQVRSAVVAVALTRASNHRSRSGSSPAGPDSRTPAAAPRADRRTALRPSATAPARRRRLRRRAIEQRVSARLTIDAPTRVTNDAARNGRASAMNGRASTEPEGTGGGPTDVIDRAAASAGHPRDRRSDEPAPARTASARAPRARESASAWASPPRRQGDGRCADARPSPFLLHPSSRRACAAHHRCVAATFLHRRCSPTSPGRPSSRSSRRAGTASAALP